MVPGRGKKLAGVETLEAVEKRVHRLVSEKVGIGRRKVFVRKAS